MGEPREPWYLVDLDGKVHLMGGVEAETFCGLEAATGVYLRASKKSATCQDCKSKQREAVSA